MGVALLRGAHGQQHARSGGEAGGTARRLQQLPRQAAPVAGPRRPDPLRAGQVGRLRADPRAGEITLLDVVRAVDGPGPSFVCTEIRQRGPFATPADSCTTPCPVSRAMWAAEDAWHQALAAVTIADLARDVDANSGPEALVGIQAWLTGGAG